MAQCLLNVLQLFAIHFLTDDEISQLLAACFTMRQKITQFGTLKGHLSSTLYMHYLRQIHRRYCYPLYYFISMRKSTR